MKNPLFSVLIANYNNGRYLQEAVDSVRSQTYTNWEIILVDDASTDNSKELYKELEKDSHIHIFYNEENKGCGYTKRRCAELAKGEV
ncbi:MAG: glycosyltransferase family 2 protein [Salinivirgaceae bacterium]|nr:glycosyltransferase family 2 protein [Salinivirgaceae bacterium]